MPHHIVALGSSFASGPGIEPIADKAAGRSKRNYPALLAELTGAQLTDRTASGATTAHILHQRQHSGISFRGRNPQLANFPANTDLVTLTAGGNDLGYLASMIKVGCAQRITNPLLRPLSQLLRRGGIPTVSDSEILSTAEDIARIVDTVRSHAPAARVFLVEYLALIGSDTQALTPAVPFTHQQLSALRHIADSLVRVYAKAAELTGAEVVPMSTLSAAHALGSPQPWVTGMPAKLTGIASRPPFHPNAAGMEATAAAIAEQLQQAPAG